MHKDENTRRRRPSRSSLSLSGVVAVVVLYRFSRQRLRARHDVTPFLPSSLSLHCSLTPHSSAGYMRASERSSERVAPPGPTRSSRHRRRCRGPIIANLCAEPLYYLRRSGALLPSLSPSLVAVAACPFGPSLVRRPFVVWPCTKKAMKSRYLSRLLRIPLLLFASRCAEHRRERESGRRKKPFLPLAHSSFIHRRVEYTFRNCRPFAFVRSFIPTYSGGGGGSIFWRV